MKYQKYLVLAFVAALFLPLLSAKSAEATQSELNIDSINYLELEEKTELGFDTSKYLPENFDAFNDSFSIESLNYIEDDSIELGFDTQNYLPDNFNAYQK